VHSSVKNGDGDVVKIGIPKETHLGERRVAATPATVVKLLKLGFEVQIQSGAGESAHLLDADFVTAGATLVDSAETLWASSNLVLKVRPPSVEELALMTDSSQLISLFFPSQNSNLIDRLAAKKCTVIALDQIPRISRAQKMDVLSSMANIAGYRAVIEAANHFGSFFAGQITAAGRTRPAQVLVIGAGVAGLAAVAAARGLGAEVRAFDVRPAVKEQVESLGARFLELTFEEEEGTETAGGYAKEMSQAFLDAEFALFAEQAKEVDIIITTALIPGKKAPELITKAMVDTMKPGSIVVDLAAEQGGNCAYTQPDRAVEVKGVTILGYTDLTSRLATHASQLFSTNIVNLLSDMVGDEGYQVDLEDEVVRKALVVHQGQVTWPPPPDPEKAVAPPPTLEAPKVAPAPVAKASHGSASEPGSLVPVVALSALLLILGLSNPDKQLVHNLTVFALACFVGWQVVWSVKPALHTPLMSVTNAISGIIVVGGMLQVGVGEPGSVPSLMGAAAILVASINIAGGFWVTQRMLKMFRREAK
jgi:NAD(P) transhydrogenase subunit alpha